MLKGLSWTVSHLGPQNEIWFYIPELIYCISLRFSWKLFRNWAKKITKIRFLEFRMPLFFYFFSRLSKKGKNEYELRLKYIKKLDKTLKKLILKSLNNPIEPSNNVPYSTAHWWKWHTVHDQLPPGRHREHSQKTHKDTGVLDSATFWQWLCHSQVSYCITFHYYCGLG